LKLGIPVIAVIILSVSIVSISAEEELIPLWIKTIAEFWVSDDVSDAEFISAMEWMIQNGLIKVSNIDDDGWKNEADKLYRENQRLEDEISDLRSENKDLRKELGSISVTTTKPKEFGYSWVGGDPINIGGITVYINCFIGTSTRSVYSVVYIRCCIDALFIHSVVYTITWFIYSVVYIRCCIDALFIHSVVYIHCCIDALFIHSVVYIRCCIDALFIHSVVYIHCCIDALLIHCIIIIHYHSAFDGIIVFHMDEATCGIAPYTYIKSVYVVSIYRHTRCG